MKPADSRESNHLGFWAGSRFWSPRRWRLFVEAEVCSIAVIIQDRRVEEAEDHFRQALTLREKALGADHLDVARATSALDHFLWRQKKYREGEDLMLRSLGILEARLPPDSLILIQARRDYAELLTDQLENSLDPQ